MSRDVFKYLIYMNDIIEMNSEEKYEGNIRILQASGISEFLLFQDKGWAILCLSRIIYGQD